MSDIRDMFLEPGYYFGFRMDVGEDTAKKMFFKIDGFTYTRYLFTLKSTLAAVTASTFTEVKETNGKKPVEPAKENIMNHCYWGVTPAYVRVWRQYEGINVGDLKQSIGTPSSTTKCGYIKGHQSPLDFPSRVTEFLGIHDLNVYFNAVNMNPTGGSAVDVKMEFHIGKMRVEAVTDRDKIHKFLHDRSRYYPFTVGSLEIPVSAPAWLKTIYDNHYKGVR